MTQTVDFIYDFGSPNAYLAHKLLPGIEQRTGAKFNYVTCLLGGIFKTTGNQSPVMAFSGVKGKLAYEMLELKRFVARHELGQFKFNSSFPIISTLMMRTAIAAEEDGILPAVADLFYAATWEQDKKTDDPEVVTQALNDAGFDGANLTARAQEQPIKDKLRANTEAAVERGVFGAPTFFVGTEMFFGKDRLGQVEEEILASR